MLTEKPDSERQQLVTQARALTNSIKALHVQNAARTQAELRSEYQKIYEDKTKDDRLSMRYCNLISSDRKSFVPLSADQVDDKRLKFNREIGVDGKNKILYLTALCRFFNTSYLTTIRNPKEFGMTAAKTENEIKRFLDSFNMNDEF